MIIVKIWGGLGNQMFQYAAAKALSEGNKTELKLDISHFDLELPGETPRRYSLNVFPNIQERIAEKEEVYNIIPRFKSPLLKKIYYNINKRIFNFNKSYITDAVIPGSGVSMAGKKSAYLEGYWQSEKFFKSAAEIISACFSLEHLMDSPSLQPYIKDIQSGVSASIHIRRGDYVSHAATNAFHGVIDLSYYKTSIDALVRSTSPGIRFFIFSDDINWCKENLEIPYSHTYISTGEDHHDLYLMSICKHNIIANSSFSWWGAWLNKNPGKIVIAPQNWFSRQASTEIIPESWVTK